jgi:hypothetical protein
LWVIGVSSSLTYSPPVLRICRLTVAQPVTSIPRNNQRRGFIVSSGVAPQRDFLGRTARYKQQVSTDNN